MTQFWSQEQTKKEKAFRSQSAVQPLYMNSVERKKSLEHRENEVGMNVKASLLKKHFGREQLVNSQVQKKQEEVHQPHLELI